MRLRLSLGLALGAILLASGCEPEDQDASRSKIGSAPPSTPSASTGVIDASWVAPTTNADGSPLTDLAFYRLYYYSDPSTPCPYSAFLDVASPTPSPQTFETVVFRLTGLLAGVRYFAAVTAVDSFGVESACSPVGSGIAREVGVTGAAAHLSPSAQSPGELVGSIANTGSSGGSSVAMQMPVSTLTGLTANLGPQLPGATVTFTATAAGGTAPYQFKWWLWDGATWIVLKDWSTGNTFAWTPSMANPNLAVGVWVRSAGNTADQPDGYPANTGAYRAILFAIN